MPERMLGRWEKGYVEAGTPGGEEGYASLASFSDPQSALVALEAMVEESIDQAFSVTYAARVEPRNGDDEPYANINIGDAAQFPDMSMVPQTVRLMGITVNEDGEGNPTFDLQLNSLLEIEGERTQRKVDALLTGADGTSSAVSNASDLGANIPSGVLTDAVFATYNHPNDLTLDIGDPSPVTSPIRLYRTLIALRSSGSTSTIIEFFKNGGTAFDSVEILAGDDGPIDHYVNADATDGDVLFIAITEAGFGAAGLVVEMHATSQV